MGKGAKVVCDCFDTCKYMDYYHLVRPVWKPSLLDDKRHTQELQNWKIRIQPTFFLKMAGKLIMDYFQSAKFIQNLKAQRLMCDTQNATKEFSGCFGSGVFAPQVIKQRQVYLKIWLWGSVLDFAAVSFARILELPKFTLWDTCCELSHI